MLPQVDGTIIECYDVTMRKLRIYCGVMCIATTVVLCLHILNSIVARNTSLQRIANIPVTTPKVPKMTPNVPVTTPNVPVTTPIVPVMTYTYPNISAFDSHSDSYGELIQLHWTSLGGTNEQNSYHFFSAYYDGRTSKDLQRPAVIIMGYVDRRKPSIKFYCLFRYNNHSTCKETPAKQRHVSPCFPPQLPSKPYHYVCEMLASEEVPLAIHLSTAKACMPDSISAPIPVQNRNANVEEKPAKTFGVCVSGPLVKEKDTFMRDVVEYVEMSIVVGVQLIVFYVNEEQVDMRELQYLFKHYPALVKIIAWRRFAKWDPLHYYGQLLLMSDCLYRHMYKVEYLAMTDLDEMIMPVGDHNSWGDMMTALNSNSDVSTFTFQNTFFTAPENEPNQVASNCTLIPKYFTRNVRHKCHPGFQYKPKQMDIARYIYEPNIHWACAKVDGHFGNIDVPTEIGILAHYRSSLPENCVGKPTFTDNVASKFRDKVMDSICS